MPVTEKASYHWGIQDIPEACSHRQSVIMKEHFISYAPMYLTVAISLLQPKIQHGPWSEPHYIEGADGIDPSLFFDEDGTCYYIGTHPNPAGCQYDGDWYIWIQELDIENMKLVGEVHNVWNGAMRNIIWPEDRICIKSGNTIISCMQREAPAGSRSYCMPQ